MTTITKNNSTTNAESLNEEVQGMTQEQERILKFDEVAKAIPDLFAEALSKKCDELGIHPEHEEVENLFIGARDELRAGLLSKKLAKESSKQTLFAVKNWRWWADKFATAGITIVTGAVLMVGTSKVNQAMANRAAKKNEEANPLASTGESKESPYANPEASFQARPLRARKEASVGMTSTH